ncbi:MAG: FTR1 family protein, partial [Rickettsiaceae bacterium]|nr:FTR1 family protein [Rickettsiaceae bacterium]
MFKIAIVVFREFLEIALLLGIIMAVTKPVKNSRTYIVLGALIGIVLAAIFALSTRRISTSFGSLG